MNLELITALRAEIDQLKSERNEAQVEVQRLNQYVADLHVEHAALGREVTERGEALAQYQQATGEHQRVALDAMQRADNAEVEVERLRTTVAALDQDAKELRIERDEAKRTLQKVRELSQEAIDDEYPPRVHAHVLSVIDSAAFGEAP